MTLYVSPTATAGASDQGCDSAAYATVQSAVDAASPNATVVVCSGTYTEDVVISTPLTLSGQPGAVIQGSPTTTAECKFIGPGGPVSAPCLAAITIATGDVTVENLTVTGAIGEGILATGSLSGGSIADVAIVHNRVVGNDTGGLRPTTMSPYPQCVEVQNVPGDCGEGIHLMGVAHSTVAGNFVAHNTGGILLTDEFGPTHDNLIRGNVVTRNPFDCGITLPGHNPYALSPSGRRRPWAAGVYDNAIVHNRITFNGLRGEGAGVLFANATAGTASYDNLVAHNLIAHNDLAGVTMHAHTIAAGQHEYLSGNTVIWNTIGRNNLGGDLLDGSGPSDTLTTGILVYSGSVPVWTRIADNQIVRNHYGIWTGVGGNVNVVHYGNVYLHVAVPVFTAP